MSSDEVAIRVRGVSKHYLMFARPEDRLKQSIVPRLQRLAGRRPTQYYRDFTALNGISFDIRRGETVGIIGRNGCGKSTLLQIVCGTLLPTSGTVDVNGRIAALLELGAGFDPEFTGRENVYMNGAILGLARADIDRRFADIARFADIGDFIEQPVKTYSSGMYVRLAFATAINVDPDILVVDEALSVGDEAFQRKCFARIEDIKDKGGTVLFVSHGAQTILQLCDRAMLIDGGELILEGRPKMVVSHYQRLVNAAPEAAPEIRASILQIRDAPLKPAPVAASAGEGIVAPAAVRCLSELAGAAAGEARADEALAESYAPPAPPPPADDDLADYLDPGLKPESTVCLEERGACIREARITTVDGKVINVLRMGKRYVFEYRILFLCHVRDVGFGMQIRTVSGVPVTGVHTSQSRIQRLPSAAAHDELIVRFEFTCLLLPATYFIVCGALGNVAGTEVLLHRIYDATCFRVANEPDLISTGTVDAGFQVAYAKCLATH